MIVRVFKVAFLLIWAIMMLTSTGSATSNAFKGKVFDPGPLKATDSVLKVKLGDPAPDFTLPSISGTSVTLSYFKGKKNVLISFVPAAWTPVCSDQ
jgi:peroxiredoxin (alkyl hydroperoxide reductase subunit C)